MNAGALGLLKSIDLLCARGKKEARNLFPFGEKPNVGLLRESNMSDCSKAPECKTRGVSGNEAYFGARRSDWRRAQHSGQVFFNSLYAPFSGRTSRPAASAELGMNRLADSRVFSDLLGAVATSCSDHSCPAPGSSTETTVPGVDRRVFVDATEPEAISRADHDTFSVASGLRARRWPGLRARRWPGVHLPITPDEAMATGTISKADDARSSVASGLRARRWPGLRARRPHAGLPEGNEVLGSLFRQPGVPDKAPVRNLETVRDTWIAEDFGSSDQTGHGLLPVASGLRARRAPVGLGARPSPAGPRVTLVATNSSHAKGPDTGLKGDGVRPFSSTVVTNSPEGMVADTILKPIRVVNGLDPEYVTPVANVPEAPGPGTISKTDAVRQHPVMVMAVPREQTESDVRQNTPLHRAGPVGSSPQPDPAALLKTHPDIADDIFMLEMTRRELGRESLPRMPNETQGHVTSPKLASNSTMRMASPGDADTTPGRNPDVTVSSSNLDRYVAPGAVRSEGTDRVVAEVVHRVAAPVAANANGENRPSAMSRANAVSRHTVTVATKVPEEAVATAVLKASGLRPHPAAASTNAPEEMGAATILKAGDFRSHPETVATNVPKAKGSATALTANDINDRPFTVTTNVSDEAGLVAILKGDGFRPHPVMVTTNVPEKTETPTVLRADSAGRHPATVVANGRAQVGADAVLSANGVTPDPLTVTTDVPEETVTEGVLTANGVGPHYLTGVTTARRQHVSVPGKVPQAMPLSPTRASGLLEQLPAVDPEIGERLRAYLEFGRRPAQPMKGDFLLAPDRQGAAGKGILNENRLAFRGGFGTPEVEMPPGSVEMSSPGIDTGVGPRTQPGVSHLSPGAKTGGGGAPNDRLTGGDTRCEFAGAAGEDAGNVNKTGTPDKATVKEPGFDSALLAKTGLSSDLYISSGKGPERVFDVFVEKVFSSVMERIQASDFERSRARFEIETDQGATIRVRLTVDHNIVSARIDAPSEELRDMLAGHAWELDQHLETEGFIPNDIEFCLAGGREQAANHGTRPGIHRAFADTTPDEDIENFTMVETEAYAFESWA